MPGALARLLAAASPRDAITIANLYVLVPRAARTPVLARLSELAPPPGALTIEDAAGSPAQFEVWREHVVNLHFGAPR